MDLINDGFLPEAIINYIALLGWAPSDNREIFDLDELTKVFDIHGISKSPSVFDYDKLEWVNAEHIKAMDTETFTAHAKPYYDRYGISEDKYALLDEILKPRITRFNQLEEKLAFLGELADYDISLFEHKKSKSSIESSVKMLEDSIPLLENTPWDRDAITEALKAYAESNEIKNSVIMWPVRIAAAGVAVTPGGCAEVLILLGKDESLRRIRIGLEKIKEL